MKIAIFGASPQGRFVRMMLDEDKYSVVVYFDNGRLPLERGNIDGIPVDTVTNASMYDFDYLIVAIPEYQNSMMRQAVSAGIPKDRILVFMKGNDSVSFLNDTRIAQLRLCIQDIKRKGVKGSMAELGVNKGDFAKYMNAGLPDRKIYLFDTFEGFCEKDFNISDNRTDYFDLFLDTNIQTVMDKMICPQNVIIRKGWFPDTLEGMPNDETYCLVSLDTDLYKPMIAGLRYFYPRLQKGGYIFIHDFMNEDWKGIRNAVTEFCEENNTGYVPVHDRCGSAIITK